MKKKGTLNSIQEILKKENLGSLEEVLLNHSLLLVLTKRDEYELECQKFKQKYQMNFETFKMHIGEKKNEEEFEKDDDLMDWEFAEEALLWWKQKIEELNGTTQGP